MFMERCPTSSNSMNADHLLRLARVMLLSLGLVAVPCAAVGATYYVDASLGRDGASGLRPEIDGREGPIRSLARVGQLHLFSGDQVLLKCGQTFEGPLRIKVQDRGGEGSLKLGAYGQCTPATYPVITGLQALPKGDSMPSGLTQWQVSAPVGHLIVDGKFLPVARHPSKGYHIWTAEGEQTDGAAALRAWVGAKDIGGARAWVRTQDWLLEERRLTGRGGAARLDNKLEYPIRKGVGIYLTGKPWMIGLEPAWAYDEERQYLTARLPAGARNVSMATDEGLVEIRSTGGVSVSQWRLVDAGGTALYIHAHEAFAQVKDVIIERAGRNGLHIGGSIYAVVDNNTITDTGMDGIFLTEGRRVFVRGNTVRRAGLWGHPKSVLAAINAHRTSRASIEGNLVDGAGYIGIRFSGDAQVRRNIVLNSCQVLSDCGAIYTWRRDVNHVTAPCDVSYNTIIGVRGDTSVRYSMVDFFSGIYLDDFTRDVDVIGNVVLDAAQGIYVHNALRNKVIANSVLGTRDKPDAILLRIDRHRFPASENMHNEVRDNDITPTFPAYKLPTDFRAGSDRIALVDAGRQKIALGWGNWSSVDWAKWAPGCRPGGRYIHRLGGELSAQPTAVVLDCISAKP